MKTKSKPKKIYKQKRISLYLDKEFEHELYPKLKELGEREERSATYMIKKAVKKFLIDRKMIKSANKT